MSIRRKDCGIKAHRCSSFNQGSDFSLHSTQTARKRLVVRNITTSITNNAQIVVAKLVSPTATMEPSTVYMNGVAIVISMAATSVMMPHYRVTMHENEDGFCLWFRDISLKMCLHSEDGPISIEPTEAQKPDRPICGIFGGITVTITHEPNDIVAVRVRKAFADEKRNLFPSPTIEIQDILKTITELDYTVMAEFENGISRLESICPTRIPLSMGPVLWWIVDGVGQKIVNEYNLPIWKVYLTGDLCGSHCSVRDVRWVWEVPGVIEKSVQYVEGSTLVHSLEYKIPNVGEVHWIPQDDIIEVICPRTTGKRLFRPADLVPVLETVRQAGLNGNSSRVQPMLPFHVQ